MKTPICDFADNYIKSNTLRMHMPGHKGSTLLGFEPLDITEIKGADSLYEADGIIAESEAISSSLFGCPTFYSAEGSSLCIRAMLYLVSLYAKDKNKSNIILASRNAHKTFINTIALLDLEVQWLMPEADSSYLSVNITTEGLDKALGEAPLLPVAVYITSPDYLGNTSDIKGLSAVCRRHGVLLIVDNAHGAYLNFLDTSLHPISLGADMCCDSAHKTLPVVTGGAYLHISDNADKHFTENAKKALSLFGSTSPSYLILESLDKANAYLGSQYRADLKAFIEKTDILKADLTAGGYDLYGDEPIKLTIEAKKYGYTGVELADVLRASNIECEFSDNDYTVLMLTPENKADELDLLKGTLLSGPKKQEITEKAPLNKLPRKAMSVRAATLAPCETVDASDSIGRVLAFADVGCPPAVPIIVSGEIIDENTLKAFEYYGITRVCVVK